MGLARAKSLDTNRGNDRMQRLLVASLSLWMLLLASCTSVPLEQGLVGRWTVKGETQWVEFGPEGLYSQYVDGLVESGIWEVKNGSLSLLVLTGADRGKTVVWKLGKVDESFDREINSAQVLHYVKDKYREIFDQRLVGLWRNDLGEHSGVIEFTPRGTVLGVIWQEDEKDELYAAGIVSTVTRHDSSGFLLDGYLGNRTLPPRQVQEFRFEGGDLVWETRPKDERTWRKITRGDIPRE